MPGDWSASGGRSCPAGGTRHTGKPVPAEPKNPRYLTLGADLQERDITIHGLTGDVALVKSYVYDHYVRGGQFLVELAWWIENIENDMWAAGAATVALPSRGDSGGTI